MGARGEGPMSERVNVIGLMLEYEQGQADEQQTLTLFSVLVSTGTAWRLQGHYGRTAAALIEGGYLSPEGDILKAAS